jgi:CHAT domain-containing protein/Flp pilus assembly protein TadD
VALFQAVGAVQPARADASQSRKLIEEGDRLFNAGQTGRSLDIYGQALERARREGNRVLEAQALYDLGAARLVLGQDGEARRLFRAGSELGRFADQARPAATEKGNLLLNGDFEAGLLSPWGTGHYERRGGRFSFGIWWNSKNARSYFKVDTAESHTGRQSLQIRNFSKPAPHVFGTTSQRIGGLTPNRVYRLALWAKAKGLERGAVSFTIDPGWNLRPINLPGGSYEWRRFTAAVCIGPLNAMDFRVIHQAPGTVWLDDISVTQVAPGTSERDAQEPLAECDLAAGRYQAALDHFSALLEIYKGEDNKSAQGRTHYAIGRVQFRLGYYARALESFRQASKLAMIPTDINRGDLYTELGDYVQAEQYYQQALKRVWGDQATRSRVFKRLGTLSMLREENDQALDYLSKALIIQRHIGDKASAAETLLEIGQLKQRIGQWDEAAKVYEEALATSLKVQERQLEANLETQRGFLYLERNLLDDARGRFKRALKLQRSLRNRRGIVLALFGAGRTDESASTLDQAEKNYKEAVGLLEDIRAAFPAESPVRQTFLEVNRQIYARLIGVLLKRGKGDEALEYLERSRSKNLRDQFNQMDIAFRDTDRKAAWEKERALAARRQTQEERLAEETAKPSNRQNAAQIRALKESLSVTAEEYRNFLYELFRRYPDLRHHVSIDPKELKRQRTRLPDDMALVEYLLGEKELYCFILTSKEVKAKVVPVERSTLEGKINYLMSLASDSALAGSLGPVEPSTLKTRGETKSPFAPKLLTAFRQTSAELYGYLIEPIASEIAGKPTIGVAPDGHLAAFPFQLLGVKRDGGFHWLLEDHALFYFHSLDFLRHPPSAGLQGDPSPGLVAFGNADGSLPHSEQEVQLLKTSNPEVSVYIREEATEERVKSEARKTARLHLATHGILDYTDIRKSYLAFAPNPAGGEDGRLTLGEVWSLPLEKMDLVTLSACQTAVGEVSRGTGVVNPATAFLDAGAHSVVATLWLVDDEATSELVKRFYKHLRSTSAVEALRRAQLSLALDSRYAFPYYWGGFILLGSWM